jgi:hypothetical protein
VSAQGYAQSREAHPLLDPFPFALMTLAIVMVIFALTMAGLNAGADPDLRASTGTQAVLGSPGGAASTRPGGRGASDAAAKAAAAAESSRTTTKSSTRTGAGSVTTEAKDD